MSETVIASVLFTDLVDSTAIAVRLGPERAEALRVAHFALLRDVVAATGGTEVKNVGDGLMVFYATPSSALVGATTMQQRLARHNARAPDPLLVRIGLSVGEAYADDGDYFGESVIEAARLCDAAEGAQILATELLQNMAGRHAPFEFSSVGQIHLKGLPEPVSAVEVLWQSVSTGSPVPFPSMLAGITRDSLFGFVGRDTELGIIDDAHKLAFTDPQLHTVLVAGEAGIGKTAMLARVAAQYHEAGAVVLLGHCDEDATAPFQIWIQALTHLAEHLGEAAAETLSPAHRRAIARLVPAFSAPGAGSGDAESDRAVIVHSVEILLRAVAAEHPIVVVLDDLQWADAASLHILRNLISSAGEMAVIILCTYRHTDLAQNEPLTALLADLHRQPGVTRLKLVGLDDAETVQLVSAAAGHELDDDTVRFAHAVRRETDGNPLFTRELLRHLGEAGVVSRTEGGRWFVDGDPDGTPLPASIRDVVARRVNRLGAIGARILSTASVLGRDFELEVLAQVAQRGENEVLDVLEAATDAAIVLERTDFPGSYRFSHALIQRTLYEDIGAARRARTHRRAAEVLEAGNGPARPADLARHWVATLGLAEEQLALRYVIEAADDALASLAPDDAISWYRQAIALSTRQDDSDALRGRLLVGMGTAQRQVGDAGYRTSLLGAAELARRAEDTDLLVAAILAADRGVAGTSGADVEFVEAIDAALAAIGPDDSIARARLLSILSQTIHAREWMRRRDLSTEAVAVARRVGDPTTLAAVLPVAYQHYGPDGLDDRLRDTLQAIELAKNQGNPIMHCNALFHRIDACIQTADREAVDAGIAELSAEARSLGLPLHLWQLHMITSLRALVAGDCDQAEADANTAFEVGSAGGHVEAMAAYGVQLIEVRRQQGRLDEMVGFLEDAAGENAAVAGFAQLLSSVYCDVGRLDEAADLLSRDQATDFDGIPRDAAWMTIVSSCAGVAATLRESDTCRVLYRLLAPHAGQIASVYSTSTGAVDRHLGRLAHVLGDDTRAEAHFADALDLHGRMRAPYWTAITQLDLAEVIAGTGDAARAAGLLDEARSTAVSHGFGGLVKRAQQPAG